MIDRIEEVRKLKVSGLTYAEIGEIMGVSRQRVQQILAPKNKHSEFLKSQINGLYYRKAVAVTTKPLPVIATLDEIERKAKQAFVDTQRELARIARARIDGDARATPSPAPPAKRGPGGETRA